MMCGAVCTDTQFDTMHCGDCDTMCAVGQLCLDGNCDCVGPFELCDGACVDLRNDVNNCGDCGNTCAAGQVCRGGDCRG
jgi:hypothetical protein